MADLEIALKRPGLGVLFLNGSAIALLQSTLQIFDRAGSIWTRLAIVCFGLGAMAGVLCLLVEIVIPAKVPIIPSRNMHNPHAVRKARQKLRKSLVIPQLVIGLLLGGGAVLIVTSVFAGWEAVPLFGFLFLMAAAGFAVWFGERLRDRARRVEDVVLCARSNWAETPTLDTTELALHRILLGLGFGLFALGVIAAVNQPFTRAARDVRCEVANIAGEQCESGGNGVREETGRDGSPENRPGDAGTQGKAGSLGLDGKAGSPGADGSAGDPGIDGDPGGPGPEVVGTALAPADLLFAFDSSELEPNAGPILRAMAESIRRGRRGGPVVVTGHTDALGPPAYNVELSLARARSVAQRLETADGLARVPFEVRGKGAAEPIAANARPDGSDNPEGRQLNRRVVATFQR